MNARNQNDRSIQVTGLKDGEQVSGPRTINTEAGQAVKNVRYILTGPHGDILSTRFRRNAPYSLERDESNPDQPGAIDTRDYPDGRYQLKVIGYSDRGHWIDHKSIGFTIQQKPGQPNRGDQKNSSRNQANDVDQDQSVRPTVKVSGLTAGQHIEGALRVTVSANKPITSVDFQIPGVAKRTEREAPYSLAGDEGNRVHAWDTNSIDDGDYQLRVKVNLDSGRTVSRSIPFSVDNESDQPASREGDSDKADKDQEQSQSANPQIEPADSDSAGAGEEDDGPQRRKSQDNSPSGTKAPTTPKSGSSEDQSTEDGLDDRADSGGATAQPISIEGVSEGQTIRGKQVVMAQPNVEVESIRFVIPNGDVDQLEEIAPYSLVGDDNGRPYEWDSTQAEDGPHQLKVAATLPDGQVVHRTINFKVDNAGDEDQSNSASKQDADQSSHETTDERTATGAPKLVPGSGFAGPTPQPPAQGERDDFGYNFQAMARFDVVPDQTFTDQFEVGVVAFHSEGIDRVEFSVDGGPWTAVHEPTLNPRTKVREYWAVLDAEDFDPGQLHVRAVVYPNVGLPRVLPSDDLGYDVGLSLNADPGRTLPRDSVYVLPRGAKQKVSDRPSGKRDDPFGSIRDAVRALNDRDEFSIAGSTIYLLPGEYPIDDVAMPRITRIHRWMTITTAPGTTRERARIVRWDGGGLNMNRLHLKDVTYAPEDDGKISNSSHTDPDYFWADHVRLDGSSRYRTDGMARGFSLTFETDSLYTDAHSGFSGAVVRNCRVKGVIDAYSRPGLIVNCSAYDVNDIARGPAHPDVIDYGSPDEGEHLENKIVYNLTAKSVVAQGVITKNLNIRGMAFVNVNIDTVTGVREHGVVNLHLDSRIENMYIKDSRFYGRCSLRTDKTFDAHGLIFENTQVGTSPPWIPDELPLKGVYLRGYSNAD